MPKSIFVYLVALFFLIGSVLFLSSYFLNTSTSELIEQNNEKVLVDAGCRDIFGPTCGFFPEQLEKAGTNPEEITDLFLSLIHI